MGCCARGTPPMSKIFAPKSPTTTDSKNARSGQRRADVQTASAAKSAGPADANASPGSGSVSGGQPGPRGREAVSADWQGLFRSTREKEASAVAPWSPLQRKGATAQEGASAPRSTNAGGLPADLQRGVEALSGVSMDGVRVTYNSERPAQLHALAFAHGRDIHLAPGQEKHLPHEAWHVVQQQQGRVPATRQLKGLGLNDDAALEREADVMGARAARFRGDAAVSPLPVKHSPTESIQRVVSDDLKEGTVVKIGGGINGGKYAVIRDEYKNADEKIIGYRVQVIDNNDFLGYLTNCEYKHLNDADPNAKDYPDIEEITSRYVNKGKKDNKENYGNQKVEEKDLKKERPKQPSTKVSVLMNWAKDFHLAFTNWLTPTAESCRGQTHVKKALKSKGSAHRKLLKHASKQAQQNNQPIPNPQTDKDYDEFDASGQFDFLRATISVPNLYWLKRAVIAIEKSSSVKVMAKRNRYFGRSPNKKDNAALENGYRDVNFTLALIPNKFPELKGQELPQGYLVELQINLNAIVRWKELPHSIYEATRQDKPIEDEHERKSLLENLEKTIDALKDINFDKTSIEKVEKLKSAIEKDKNWSIKANEKGPLIDISRAIYKMIFAKIEPRLKNQAKSKFYEKDKDVSVNKSDINAYFASSVDTQIEEQQKEQEKEQLKNPLDKALDLAAQTQNPDGANEGLEQNEEKEQDGEEERVDNEEEFADQEFSELEEESL